MRILSKLRIRNKIIVIIVVIGALSTITGSMFNYFYELRNTKVRLIENTFLQAKLISENCWLALEFNYEKKAADALQQLHTIPNVQKAALYTLNDSLFASYHKSGNTSFNIPKELRMADFYINGDNLFIKQTVLYKDKIYGTLYLQSNINWSAIATSRLLITLAIIAFVLIFVVVLAFILQRRISQPIIALSHEMGVVAQKKDYTVQLANFDKDEIGELYSEFNKMLSEINNRENDLKKALEALRKSEAIQNKMVSNIGDVIVIIDQNGINQYKSPNVTKLFGWEPEELVGKSTWDNLHHDDLEAAQKFVGTIFSEPNASGTTEIRYKRKDNKYVWIEVTLVNLMADPDIRGLLGNYHDITERKRSELLLQEKTDEIEKQNEEYLQLNEEINQTNKELIKEKEHAEESDRLKTAFLQNMSHEIRTPMNAIMGFSSLLVDNYNNKEKLERFSEIINHRCKDLLDIIEDILDISKIESGQLPVNIEECNLNDLFNDLTSFFADYKTRIGKQHIKFSLQNQYNPLESVIETDKGKLKQIFINLISNAFKFTSNGSIEGGCKFDNNHNLLFYVSDTGIGIPPEKQNIVFERFTQLNPGVNKLVSGTGLGLSIVKGLVGLLGSEITLESELGKGSTFSFSMPIKTVKNPQYEPFVKEKFDGYHFINKSVLIVEDDHYNANYLKEILTIYGFTIFHTEYGNEAIKMALAHTLDIILMDIRLPDIDGYNATRQIRLLKPQIKIIAQTAYASQDEKQKALDAGCNDYISKPINRSLLLNMMSKQLYK